MTDGWTDIMEIENISSLHSAERSETFNNAGKQKTARNI